MRDSERPRIHTFIATSDIHIERKLQTTREDVKGQVRAAVAQAREYTDDVEFSPEDGSRSDVEFMAEVIQIALDEGATTINVPDTVGYTMPREYARDVRASSTALVPGLRDVVVSVHCHDDLGLAVANSLAGLRSRLPPGRVRDQRHRRARRQRLAGGDRDAAAHARAERSGLWTGVETTEIARTSRLVSRLTGYPVQPNKAIVGRNAFAHEAGIHQDGVLKERTTYEIMDATTVGLRSNSIVLGKHSGRHALRQSARGDGLRARRAGAEHGLQALQGDRRPQEAGDRDGPRGARHRRAARGDRRLRARVVRGRGLLARARRTRRVVGDARPTASSATGELHRRRADRRGLPGDQRRHRRRRELSEFTIGAVTEGQDALGEVSVVVEVDGFTGAGQGVSTDIIDAAARAYVRALSVALARSQAGEAIGLPETADSARAQRRAGGSCVRRAAGASVITYGRMTIAAHASREHRRARRTRRRRASALGPARAGGDRRAREGAARGLRAVAARPRRAQRRQRADALAGRARRDQPHATVAARIAAGLELRLSQLLRLDEGGSVTVVRAGAAHARRQRAPRSPLRGADLRPARPARRALAPHARARRRHRRRRRPADARARQPRDRARRARLARARLRRPAPRAARGRLRDLRRRPAPPLREPRPTRRPPSWRSSPPG